MALPASAQPAHPLEIAAPVRPTRRRILYFDHTASLGGGEIALFNLVRNLDSTRYDPVVMLSSEGPLRKKLDEAGIETHVLLLSERVVQTRKDTLGLKSLTRVGEIGIILKYIRQLGRFIRREQIDVVHTNSLKADLIGGLAARLARVPVIWHVRDRIEDDYLPRPVVRVFRRLCRLIPNYIIANSAATLKTVGLPATAGGEVIHSGVEVTGRFRVIHDGVGMDQTGAAAPSGNSAPVIGIVGRISPWKGQHIFLQAAAQVHARFPQVRFQIIGSALFDEAAYERELHAQAAEAGLTECVEFLGFRSDVAERIAGLDILVHASTTGEPFGQVVIEGMVAGKPVVATRGGGVLEIVEHGVTGLLVPMGEADPMANAILTLLQEPERGRAMGRRARERVLQHFTIEHTARKVEHVYDKILQTS